MTDWKNFLAALGATATDDANQPEHARAFSFWIQNAKSTTESGLKTLAHEAARYTGAALQTKHVAVLGYATNIDVQFLTAFLDGVAWLRKRHYFVQGRPLAFEIDGLGLLGISVGLLAASKEKTSEERRWFLELLKKSLLSVEGDVSWNTSLVAASYAVLDSVITGPIDADLKVALYGKSLLEVDKATREVAWELSLNVDGLADGMTRAAARVGAIGFIARDAPAIRFDTASVDDVARVINGITRSFSHWTWERKPRTPRSKVAVWDIENEYHVQNLLWAILAPIFPDLDDEEWLKSLGQHHPRADLAIPSLGLIVEAKFIRAGNSVFTDVITEVAADASTYLRDGTGYRYLIPVVWDNLARTEHHSELRAGLLGLRGVRDAIIISRPSKMIQTAAELAHP